MSESLFGIDLSTMPTLDREDVLACQVSRILATMDASSGGIDDVGQEPAYEPATKVRDDVRSLGESARMIQRLAS